MDKTTPRLLLRPAEVADTLGLSRSQVHVMIRRGELPTVRFGKAVRVPLSGLEAVIAERMAAQQ